jgi:clan AA aspartic protease (TIGR02281 family)
MTTPPVFRNEMNVIPEPDFKNYKQAITRYDAWTRKREIIIDQNGTGHFLISGRINGKAVDLMIDTGSSWVLIPMKLQRTLGLNAGQYRAMWTASEKNVDSWQTNIENLEIGPIKLKNIEGELNPKAPNDIVLVGMTALKYVEMKHESGRLTLRQAANDELAIKKPLKECIKPGKVIDMEVMRCMEGN